MKLLINLINMFLALIISAILIGCYTANPDTEEIIYMQPDESITLSVEGLPTDRYAWSIGTPAGAEIDFVSNKSNRYIFTANIEEIQSNNVEIVCSIIQKKSGPTCNTYPLGSIEPTGYGCIDTPGWHLQIVDAKKWKIKISQNPSVWNGTYFIQNEDDIQILNDFTKITKNLYIKSDSLTDLQGLGSLSIGGSLIIENNSALTNLQELENINSIGGSLKIYDNDDLKSLDGLSNITSIGGSLHIAGNDALKSLEGFSSELTSIGGDLYIGEYPHSGNASLESLVGLGNITSIGGSLQIYDNDVLTNLKLLNDITSVGGSLFIYDSDALTSLDGLSNITSVAYLSIVGNDDLTSLAGLNNLCSVEGENYYFNYSIRVLSNSELCTNSAEKLKDQILNCDPDGVSGDIDISGNNECP